MCQRKSPRQDRDAWRAIGVSSTLTATLVFAISFNHPDSFFYHKFIYTIHISRDRPRSITPCACTFAVAPNDDNPNKSSFSTKHNLSFWAHRIRVIAYSISQRREAFAPLHTAYNIGMALLQFSVSWELKQNKMYIQSTNALWWGYGRVCVCGSMLRY